MALFIEDTFRPRLAPRWRATQVGGGRLVVIEAGLRLLIAGARPERYADAQIDDYAGLARSLGVRAERVEKPADLQPVLAACLTHAGPSLVEVAIDRGFKAML